jgi:hypothetical protein
MGNVPFRQIHLDFHTSEKIAGIGERFDSFRFADILQKSKVNSVTCFSKCHHGMIYHDTRFQARHPFLKMNLLAEQIESCHAVGIRVPVYISVGFDEFMAKRHPEWLEVTPDGRIVGASPLQAGWRKFCFNSPYIDYVIEQTLEVLDMFDVDGLFFDIISQGQCCCPRCMEGMIEAGLEPANEEDRITFAAHVLNGFKKRMTGEIRKVNQGCSIFYNAGHVSPAIRSSLDAYSHLELESLPSGGWGYHHFPITARYARNLGHEFLGMTGKFQKSWADFGSFKSKPALEYDCFTALSLGAKCSIGDQLHPSGEITKATYELIGSVYESVAEKEEWCDNVEPLTEIAVFTPEAVGASVGRIDDSIRGTYRILEEEHYQFDVIDHEMEFVKYRVIIFPDKIRFDKELTDKVNNYISSGGKVMLSHASGLDSIQDRFALNDFGISYVGEAEYSPDFLVPGKPIAAGILDSEHVMYDRGFAIKALPRVEILAKVWNPYFNRTYKHFCSHFHTPVEKKSNFPGIIKDGNILYFAHPIFGSYQRHGAKVYKQFVSNCLQLLLEDRIVRTDAPTTAHITVNHQPLHNRYVIHILHYIPERRTDAFDTIEDVIPLYNVNLSLRLPKSVKSAYLVPSKTELQVKTDGEYVSVIVPEIKGHQMVVFE